jgi:hypothetical protein
MPPEGPPEPTPLTPPEGVQVARQPELHAILKGPSRVPYVPEALGAGVQSVSLRLANAGTQRVAVNGFRMSFSTTRANVRFPCAEHVGGSVKSREPEFLEPGQSFLFERDLDCSMSLPGRYDVTVRAAWGLDATSGHDDFVGNFSCEVIEGTAGPYPIPSRPGLFVAMTGSRSTRPLREDAWARGEYRVVVAIVNGAEHPVPVGPARIAFVTYKKGSSLPCSGQAESIAFPEQLAPGATHLAQAPVACAPAEEGRYEIVGRLSLGDGIELEIGRLGVKVSRDPLLFVPEPWPSWATERPAGTWVK